jgi:WD40 repeat protein
MLVHSIGCNCIETWRMTESGAWEHFQKSAIESSPTGGATLSSDLLCLCPLDESAFLAGGVDGRVHLWKSVSMDTPLLSFSAHDGRVNDMKRAKQTDHVFTAGNDGRVCCWKTSSTGDALGLVGQAVFGDSRISSLWSLGVDGADYVFCGTNVGEVSLLSLDDTTASFRRLTTFQLAGQPTIHSLCVHSEQDPHLWIGHSNGLHIYSLSSILNLKPSSLVAL